jgi:UPF0755 protein
VDERPRVTAGGAEPPPPDAPAGGRRRGHGAALAVVLGILGGAAAIAIAVVLVRGSGDGRAAPGPVTPPATTAPLPTLRILFPEGFTRKQMAAQIRDVNEIARTKRNTGTSLVPRQYLARTASSNVPGQFAGDGKARSLEGFLFPATYEFTPVTTTQQLIDLQLKAFRDAWAQVDLSYAKKKNLTPYDVLIIASMIEKEVRVPRERPLVAAVIYNRLKARMPLGIDATLRYGLDIPPTQAITESQLESANPYNTRNRPGLPPTPIANPGLASMQAAAHPAQAGYLYFVRRKDCKSHFFARTNEEFNRFLDGPNSFLNGPNSCG